MKLIVGLGNPGQKYENTRHNLGFMALDALLAAKTPVEKTKWQEEKEIKAEVAKLDDLLLVKPQTLMNNSGWAVKKLVDFYKIDSANLWILHDDLDLPLGKIKIRFGGGTAGHHGLDSIAQHLGSFDFVRFRLGIGKPQGRDQWAKEHVRSTKVEDYVLSSFRDEEVSEVKKVITKTVEAVNAALENSLEKAMNLYNLK